MKNIPPVIVLPGVTGTYLRDEYPLPPERLWGLLQHDYARLSLHPDDQRYEALEPARVRPDSIYEIAYKEIIEELRYNLRKREDQPVPVFPFAYDWRQPLALLEEQLEAFIEEVIARTKLLRHYAEDGYADDPKVNLVGHSMGGLIITGYLEKKGKAARVSKVVTLATPFRGSFEAILKVVTGTAALTPEPSSREREAARLTPSLYHLLPNYAGAVDVQDPGLPKTLFDPGLWQPTVVQTIEEYIRLYAVSKQDRKQQARDLFTALLKTGADHRARIEGFQLSKAGLTPDDWLCVAGVDSVTRVKLSIKKGPSFELGSEHRRNEWKLDGDSRLTGDGTVPLESALPPFLKPENVVCVRPDDFGYWEIQDRLVTNVAGFHAILPNMDMLHRLIVRHFTGNKDPKQNTWGWPAPGVANAAWRPPVQPLRNKAI